MRIGFIIGRIGGVDGVALETEKWIEVLERMGHETFTLSGQFQERRMNTEKETLAPEMSFFSPESFWGQKKAFHFPETNIEELLEHIHFYAKLISEKIIAWAHERKLDVLVSENASALPAHLEMGLGIKIAVQKLGLPTITHDHDFAWERGERYVSPHDAINKIVADEFPLRLPNVIHAVINLNAKNTLKEKFGRDSVVVPNVMNFDLNFGDKTTDNKNLKAELGLAEDDKMLAQVTRIVRRKGIEVAIELIHKLQDPKIKLVITGSQADDEGSIYFNELTEMIHKYNIPQQIIFGSHIVSNYGLKAKNQNLYSLSDAYAHSAACTYFSTYEGFGNAFVEAILSKTPIFVNNYKPVYWPDIGSKGFKTVMLEDNKLTDSAVQEMKEIIYNEKLNKEISDFNFELGKKEFSYFTLQKKLEELLSKVEEYKK